MRVERLEDDDPADVESPTVGHRTAALDSRRDLTDRLDRLVDAAPSQHYETRDRATYYRDLRAAVAADRGEAASHQSSAVPAGDRGPDEVRCPDSEQPTVCDAPKARHGNDTRPVDAEVDAELHLGRERIREAERTVITPAMREIERADPGRDLVGLDHRLKGEDRLKEKVAALLDSQPEMTAGQALASIPDAIRFTFCYAEDRYAAGVRADVDRLQERGFEMVKLKNTWASEQYKGINVQWREPETGQRFEVQFHTPASFDAKQHTHDAYERIRDPATPDEQLAKLKQTQRQVCVAIPVPPGADQISNYQREQRDG